MSRALFVLLVVSFLQLDPAARETAPVDTSYRPRVGDVGLLGMYDPRAEKPGRPGPITRAELFMTMEECRLADALSDWDERGTRIEPLGDGFKPKVGTPCAVRERRIVESELDGKPNTIVLLRVEVLDGPLRDRLMWVAGYQVFRFKVAR